MSARRGSGQFDLRGWSLPGLFGAFALLVACGESPAPQPVAEPAAAPPVAEPREAPAPADPTFRRALFGAVHVHTSYSSDAFTNGTVSTPDDAYNWARGKPITGNRAGLQMQIVTPLDFYAVADHSELMGVFNQMADPKREPGLVGAGLDFLERYR